MQWVLTAERRRPVHKPALAAAAAGGPEEEAEEAAEEEAEGEDDAADADPNAVAEKEADEEAEAVTGRAADVEAEAEAEERAEADAVAEPDAEPEPEPEAEAVPRALAAVPEHAPGGSAHVPYLPSVLTLGVTLKTARPPASTTVSVHASKAPALGVPPKSIVSEATSVGPANVTVSHGFVSQGQCKQPFPATPLGVHPVSLKPSMA